MSHADDGVLHALLDGELSALEVARLESHLAGCEACRARLEEARTMIARAGQLLARAVPPGPERAAPPLHQLRHPRLAERLRAPLAWAATAVLALAIGLYASQGAFVGSDRS
ncbi:MAG: anti-sigma factor family protein, partial [Gemmatimonadales bacterium]